MKRAAMLIAAVLCLWAWAADNATVAPRAIANPKSTIVEGIDAITIPQMMSYQGKLTDTAGMPVPNGNYSVVFKLYTAPAGGSSFWGETQNVTTRAGLFSVLLGSVTPIGSMPDAGAAYLGMAVAGGNEMTPRLRIASAAYAYLARKADTANYALAGGGGAADSAWVRVGGDSVLYTIHQLGIARGGSGNILYGSLRQTHTNLGVASTTGASGQNYGYATVAGGYMNNAWEQYATVGGGQDNNAYNYATVAGGSSNGARAQYATVGGGLDDTASNVYATVGGGWANSASGQSATVAGGHSNLASAQAATVGGGEYNIASEFFSTVGGGRANNASAEAATVGGGRNNLASGQYAVVGGGQYDTASGNFAAVAGGYENSASGPHTAVGGGYDNRASGQYAVVGGGITNLASGDYAAVAGGFYDTSAASYSFTTNNRSVVPSCFNNSAAFNGQRATASNQTRVGALSKASGTFTIDHPTDPSGKILNHYFIEGPEMLNIYRGSVVLDGSGRADVRLPDYFDALNQSPHVQLTGVGTFEVYVAEEVVGNRFTIGGKPGTKVFWQVTGERQDVSAEITRRLMPVEQPKTGVLAGTMLDDDFLRGAMDQLVREGKAQGIDFRTAAGRAGYEKMKQLTGQR